MVRWPYLVLYGELRAVCIRTRERPPKEPRASRLFANRSRELPLDHPEDVLGVRDPVLLTVELDLGPRILAKDHHVPHADLDVLVNAYRHDLRCLGFLPGGVR